MQKDPNILQRILATSNERRDAHLEVNQNRWQLEHGISYGLGNSLHILLVKFVSVLKAVKVYRRGSKQDPSSSQPGQFSEADDSRNITGFRVQ